VLQVQAQVLQVQAARALQVQPQGLEHGGTGHVQGKAAQVPTHGMANGQV